MHSCCTQVLGSSLEAAVLKSDNSALAKDCRKEVKALTAMLGKLGRKVKPLFYCFKLATFCLQPPV